MVIKRLASMAIGAFIFCSLAGIAHAALSPKECGVYLKTFMGTSDKEFVKDHTAFEERRIKMLEKAHLMAPPPQQDIKAFIAKRTLLDECYYSLAINGTIQADPKLLRSIGDDNAFAAVDRTKAYMFAYILTGDPNDAIRMILAGNGGSVEIFEQVKDPDFGKIMTIMFTESLREEGNVEFSNQTPPAGVHSFGPFSDALTNLYGKWIAAAYFQGIAEKGNQLFWTQTSSIGLIYILTPFDTATDIYKEVKSVSPTGANDFIAFLLRSGRDAEVSQIMLAFPKSAIEIREYVSEYRLNTKRRLDETLYLMKQSPAATAP